ncbi:MAG: hypothetical protein Q4D02_01885 [Clostridia bacterium]|nr:hypothetical protein [Clostridia bacterium]
MINKEKIQYKLEKEAVKRNGGMCESYEYCKFCEEPKSFNRKSRTPCADALLTLKDINDMLKNYMKNKAKVSTIKERINNWENNKDILDFVDVPEYNLGMPRAKNKISNPIENQVIYKEMNKKQVEELIEIEKSKLFSLEREVKKLENAFSILSDKEMFLIECRYFENRSWENVEYNFNRKFKMKSTKKRLQNQIADIKKKILDVIKA